MPNRYEAVMNKRSVRIIQTLRGELAKPVVQNGMNAAGRNGGTVLQSGLIRNYFDSAGTTAATVDNPVGLTLDAAGTVGPELCPNGTFDNGATDWSVPAGWALGSGVVTATATNASLKQISTPCVANKTYQVEFDWTHTSGTLYVRVGTGTATTFSSSGRKSAVLVATTTAGVEFYGGAVTGVIDNIRVRELPGNHATQATTANKPILKRDASGRYYWLFDSTDLLTTTLPAGFSSATTIDARSTGHVTLQNQNIVGAYSIGPSISSYGRIILPSSPSASDLLLLQRYANWMAGVA